MNEARYSVTTKYYKMGFNSMLTIRSDESISALLALQDEAVNSLVAQGAKSDLDLSKNGSAAAPSNGHGEEHQVPECPVHHKSQLGRNGYFCPTKLPGGSWCEWEAPTST